MDKSPIKQKMNRFVCLLT